MPLVARGEGAAPLVFLPRDAWGALPAGEGGVAHRLEQITLHHTAVAARPGQDFAARLRAYQAHHMRVGWPDIAYHLLIGADGVICMGRSAAVRGDTATRYDPTGHLLVCLDGNFDQHPLPEAQYQAAVGVCAWACRDHRIPFERISPHQAHAETACPGQAVLDRFAGGALRRDVRAAPVRGVRIPLRW